MFHNFHVTTCYFSLIIIVISSSRFTVSAGFAIQAVVLAKRALKSFAPALRNWSPTCRDLPPSMPPKYCWQAITPQDLSPMSTKMSFPPLKAQNGIRLPASESSWNLVSKSVVNLF